MKQNTINNKIKKAVKPYKDLANNSIRPVFRKNISMKEKKRYLSILLIIALIFLSGIVFYDKIVNFSEIIVSSLGIVGIIITTFILDFVPQPISPDIFVLGYSIAGEPPLIIAIIVSFTSFVAGVCDYLVGRFIGKHKFRSWFGEEHFQKGKKLAEKYGIAAIAAGALTPLPYSVICWTGGIYKMKFYKFALTLLIARTMRFIIIAFTGYYLT